MYIHLVITDELTQKSQTLPPIWKNHKPLKQREKDLRLIRRMQPRTPHTTSAPLHKWNRRDKPKSNRPRPPKFRRWNRRNLLLYLRRGMAKCIPGFFKVYLPEKSSNRLVNDLTFFSFLFFGVSWILWKSKMDFLWPFHDIRWCKVSSFILLQLMGWKKNEKEKKVVSVNKFVRLEKNIANCCIWCFC